MAKVDIEIVKAVLQRAEIDARKTAQILEDINFESKQMDGDPDKEPPCKKQFVFIAADPHGDIAKLGKNFCGWVVQIPEDDNPKTALERLERGAQDFNLTPKGRRMPLKSVDEAAEFGSAKIYKEHGIWVRSKEPVLVVLTSNRIPKGAEK